MDATGVAWYRYKPGQRSNMPSFLPWRPACGTISRYLESHIVSVRHCVTRECLYGT